MKNGNKSAMEIGLIGLGPMGLGLSANAAAKAITVQAWERSAELRSTARSAGVATVHDDIVGLVAALTAPRTILLSIRSGRPVDEVLAVLAPLLGPDDVVVDGGNSNFHDTERRQAAAAAGKARILGAGISGGPAGARDGPAIMAGGPREAWQCAAPLIRAMAARAGNVPCAEWLGTGGAGHFVKMAHNAIEYGVMQVLADIAETLAAGGGLVGGDAADVIAEAGTGLAGGYLLDVSCRVLRVPAPDGAGYLIDRVDDRAEQTGTGAWFVQAAADLGVAAPVIAAAVGHRAFSNGSPLRRAAQVAGIDKQGVLPAVRPALEAACAIAFGEGLALMQATGPRFGDPLPLARIVRVWRAGSILQGRLSDHLAEALAAGDWVDPVRTIVAAGRDDLRRVAVAAQTAGIPVPALAAALACADGIDGALSTRLIQLQRDYFGGHGFRLRGAGTKDHGPWHKE